MRFHNPASWSRQAKRWLMVAFVLLVIVFWFFPPLPYQWVWRSTIQNAASAEIDRRQSSNTGSGITPYALSNPRWLNPFTVEVDATYLPGHPRGGWGVTLVLRLGPGGWSVVGEKNGWIA